MASGKVKGPYILPPSVVAVKVDICAVPSLIVRVQISIAPILTFLPKSRTRKAFDPSPEDDHAVEGFPSSALLAPHDWSFAPPP